MNHRRDFFVSKKKITAHLKPTESLPCSRCWICATDSLYLSTSFIQPSRKHLGQQATPRKCRFMIEVIQGLRELQEGHLTETWAFLNVTAPNWDLENKASAKGRYYECWGSGRGPSWKRKACWKVWSKSDHRMLKVLKTVQIPWSLGPFLSLGRRGLWLQF